MGARGRVGGGGGSAVPGSWWRNGGAEEVGELPEPELQVVASPTGCGPRAFAPAVEDITELSILGCHRVVCSHVKRANSHKPTGLGLVKGEPVPQPKQGRAIKEVRGG